MTMSMNSMAVNQRKIKPIENKKPIFELFEPKEGVTLIEDGKTKSRMK